MVREQECRSRVYHIPSEIVEEILVNLGVKSLLRFSSVSKSWNSMISDPKFISKHRRSGIRERIVFDEDLRAPSTRSISIDNATTMPLICPFLCEDSDSDSDSGVRVNLLASCGDLWCVHYGGFLFLWNPSTREYKKLAHERPFDRMDICFCVYGLGYDSLGDDYKIVKIDIRPPDLVPPDQVSKVYSLRSDSWRIIEPPYAHIYDVGGVALNGTLHWLTGSLTIISFNLSTEKYAHVARPEQVLNNWMGITVLRGKLCLHCNSDNGGKFVLWEMQEYDVAESWTKTFVTDCFNDNLKCNYLSLRPLYIYDDGRLLFLTFSDHGTNNKRETRMFMYIDEKSTPQFVSGSSCHGFGYLNCVGFGPHFCHLFGSLYLESLVSPATYRPPLSTTPSPSSLS